MTQNMTDFSEKEQIVYNLHTACPVGEDPRGIVNLWGKHLKDLIATAQVFQTQGKEIAALKYYGAGEDLALLSEIPVEVSCELFGTDKEILIRNHAHLKDRKTVVHPPLNEDPVFFVKAVAPMGYIVDISFCMPRLPLEKVELLLNYYLFHKSLMTPLEPFHSILTEFKDRQRLDLWKFLGLEWRHSVYANEKKEAYLNIDDLKNGSGCIGLVSDSIQTWEKSSRADEILKFRKDIKEALPDCLMCNYFFMCKASLIYKYGSCKTWLHAFNILHDTYCEIAKCMQNSGSSQ